MSTLTIHYPVKLFTCDRANDVPAGTGARHCLTDDFGYILPGFSDIENPTLGRMAADAINRAYDAGIRAAERRIADALGLNRED